MFENFIVTKTSKVTLLLQAFTLYRFVYNGQVEFKNYFFHIGVFLGFVHLFVLVQSIRYCDCFENFYLISEFIYILIGLSLGLAMIWYFFKY